jgi:hypothetical protein
LKLRNHKTFYFVLGAAHILVCDNEWRNYAPPDQRQHKIFVGARCEVQLGIFSERQIEADGDLIHEQGRQYFCGKNDLKRFI